MPSIRRLALLAAELGIAHEVEAGVLRVPVDESGRLIDGALGALAPLEAGLVRVVRTDIASASMASLLAVASAAPTLANLAARRSNRLLLQAIHSRAGVTAGFQPVIEVSSERIVGFEALLRVRVGSHDVHPAEVLAAAEDAGRLVEVDAVARSVALHEAAPTLGDRVLFLNVLPSSLPVPVEHLAPFLAEVLAVGLDPGRIVLEAPVGPAGTLRRHVAAVFRAASAAGFLIGLDNVRSERDLGSIDVTPDVVKLDRSLVRGLPAPSGVRTLGAVVRECQHAASMLVAQGIESVEQLQAVRDLGVRFAQGWYIGRPGAIAAEVEAVTA